MNGHLAELVFVVAVLLIWLPLAYHLLLGVAGAYYRRRALDEARGLAARALPLPRISLLIPAHNEALVLDQTLAAMARLRYPAGHLEIIVIDDASTDRTAAIARQWVARDSRFRLVEIPAAHRAGGKAAALNRAQAAAHHEVIAVYDADNTPEPDALLHLARQLAANPRLGAVVGMFRTANKNRNLLTRLINIEGIAFQWIVQAGRWQLFHLASLPGTNLLIRRDLLLRLGGWDPSALTEDQELTIQIYEAGYQVKFVPYAVTWEQEPERLGTWFRQRTRWARGHHYTIVKHLPRLWRLQPRRLRFELLYTTALYYVFFAAILVSDGLFLAGLLGLFHCQLPGPYHLVWLIAVGLFALETILALASEKEDSPANIGLTFLAYFTYCQLWVLVVGNALWDEVIRGKARVWAKTERFQPAPPAPGDPPLPPPPLADNPTTD